MSDQIGAGKFCERCGRERYYSKGLCESCYAADRRRAKGVPERPQLTRVERLERQRAAVRRYDVEHREERRVKGLANYYAKTSDPVAKQAHRERVAKWREDHPERATEIRQKYSDANREAIYAKQSQWRKANRDKVRAYELQVEARRRGARIRETVSRRQVYDACNGKCHICLTPASFETFEIDHVIPLSKGGQHVASNLAVAHPLCNRSKGGKLHTPRGQLRLL